MSSAFKIRWLIQRFHGYLKTDGIFRFFQNRTKQKQQIVSRYESDCSVNALVKQSVWMLTSQRLIVRYCIAPIEWDIFTTFFTSRDIQSLQIWQVFLSGKLKTIARAVKSNTTNEINIWFSPQTTSAIMFVVCWNIMLHVLQ